MRLETKKKIVKWLIKKLGMKDYALIHTLTVPTFYTKEAAKK